jgi:2-polyprenyl-3-methyl-5-hydroxy-6-metoxy-1,4-benzoquinol methylase
VPVTNDETSQFWDAQVATFDDEADHGLRDPEVREAWRALLREVLPQPPAEVVDLGCGTGSLSVLLAQDGYRVTGIDLSPKMVEAAVRKATHAGVDVAFRTGDAAAPEVEPATVDAVVVRHVTWALPDPARAVRGWAALLRPGGRLVLVEGRWSTGTGITAVHLQELVRPIVADVEVRPLTGAALWGRPITDERYVLVARTPG